MIFLDQNGAVVVLVCAHDLSAVRGHGGPHPVDKGPVSRRHSPPRTPPFLLARGAVHQSPCVLAQCWRFCCGLDSTVGGFLQPGKRPSTFRSANYSTVGAGDILLQRTWRLLGPAESVTGVLMCGLSAAFLFALVTWLIELEDPALAEPRAGASPCENGVATETADVLRGPLAMACNMQPDRPQCHASAPRCLSALARPPGPQLHAPALLVAL